MELNEFIKTGGKEGDHFAISTNMGAALDLNEAWYDLNVAFESSQSPYTTRVSSYHVLLVSMRGRKGLRLGRRR